MNENQYIIENSVYRRTLKKIVEMVDDTRSDKKLGQKIREFYEEEF